MKLSEDARQSAAQNLHQAVVSYQSAHGSLPETVESLRWNDGGVDDDTEPFFRACRAAALLAQAPGDPASALAEIGIRFPHRELVPVSEIGSRKSVIASGAAGFVLKIGLPSVAHKSEVGGVRMVEKADPETLRSFADDVGKRLGKPIEAVEVAERIEIPPFGEALLAAVWDDEFGAVISFGEGGVLTELRRTVVRWAPTPSFTPDRIEALIRTLPLATHWFAGYRGAPPLADAAALSRVLFAFGMAVWLFNPRGGQVIRDLEINPLILVGAPPPQPSPSEEGEGAGKPVALDLLVNVTEIERREEKRPDLTLLAKCFYGAKSIVVTGVSTTSKSNLGRTLYDRLCREFGGAAYAINPRGGDVLGKRIYTSFVELRDEVGRPDLTVYAVPARFMPAAMEEAYEAFGDDAGCSLIVSSGFDETEEGREGGNQLREIIGKFGSSPIIGPNTMALYCNSGSPGDVKVDFIPPDRMVPPSFADATKNNLALIAQSGARYVAFSDKCPGAGLRWALLLGNAYQIDVAHGVEMAADDDGISVVAVYIEGFGPGTGIRFLRAVEKCVAAGKTVVVQKVGRTAKGADAARSHTASMSGSYAVFESVMKQAGALVANTDEEFLDLSKLSSILAGRKPNGKKLFIINSAGYEGVVIADAAADAGLDLPAPDQMAQPERFTSILEKYLRGTLDPDNNPADVGPMMPDLGYFEATKAALADPVYDMALVAITPHGNAMRGTLPPYEGEDRIGPLLGELWRTTDKPIVVSINGGELYDGIAKYISQFGIPVFRSGERAVSCLAKWAHQRLGRTQ